MRILSTLFFIIGFMSSTGAFGHVHCDMGSKGEKHEMKSEKHCSHHAKKHEQKNDHHRSQKRTNSSSCMVLCCVSTLSQPFSEDVIMTPQSLLRPIDFIYSEEYPRSYNYRLFRPPIA